MAGSFALVGISEIGVGLPFSWQVTAALYALVGFGFFALACTGILCAAQ